jgi:photosystem II stability/assembly factor-like uncharacterized protein
MAEKLKKIIIVLSIAVLFCCLISGCSKAKSKFKAPNIKMVTSEYILSIDEPEEGNIWIIGNFGVIFNSSNGGETWEEQNSGVQDMLCDVDFVDSKNGWVSGIKGTMLHTNDGGYNWERQKTGTQRHLLSLCFVDTEYGWAVGDFSTILHTRDGGKTWVSQSKESDVIYSNIYFTDRSNGWIVGENGIMLHTIDGGNHWEPVMPKNFERATIEEEYTNPRPGLFGVYFSDKDHGWICGLDSTIMYTADGGVSWKFLNSGSDILYNIIVRGDRGWAVGTQGTFLLSTDGGLSWNKQEESIKSKLSFSNVYFINPQNGWIVGATGTMVRTTDGGESWKFISGLSYEFEGMKMPEGLEKRIIE